MKSSTLIPQDHLLLKNSIEAVVSQETLAKGNKKIIGKRKGGSTFMGYYRTRRREALAKGNKKILDKRKGGSICIQYYRRRRRMKSEPFKFPDLSFFDRYNYFQNHFSLNHEAEVGDAMFGDWLTNNLESIAIASNDFVDESTDGCHESVQNDCINGSMREAGLRKLTENVCPLLTDTLMTFFDPGIEHKDDTRMHEGDSDNSSAVTEVEYASLPDSFLSFSDKDCIVCILNTEDTIDNIPNSQLLDHSTENVLEDPSFDGDEQDVCHCEDDVESTTSISHLDSVQLSEGNIICSLNTEDPDIPCNDSILLIHASPSIRPQTATDFIDPASSSTQSQKDDPDLSSQFDYANPDVGNTLKSVPMDLNPSISDHNNPASDSDLPCFPDIENPEIPCNDDILLPIHPSSVRPQIATDFIDPAASFTQSQMDGPYLSSQFDSAHPHVGSPLISVSTYHNPSILDHNCDSDLPCFPDMEDPEIPCLSVRPQTVTDSIDPISSFTQSQMDGPHLLSEFDSSHQHVGSTLKSVSVVHNPAISDHYCNSDLPCFPDIEDPELRSSSLTPQTATGCINPASSFTQSQIDSPHVSSEFDSLLPHLGNALESVSMDENPSIADHNCDSDLHCFPDIEDPDIPSPSVRPQTVIDSIDPVSSFTQSQMDDPHLSCEFDSVSVDHNPSISDHNNSDSDSDLPCFADIEALIRKLDFDYAQESWITNEVKRRKYEHPKRTINRLDQSSSQRAMSSLGAFAVFYSHHFIYYIKQTEVTIGRSTDDTEVDIDLIKESHANMISRQQAIIKMETDGTFTLKNIGKGSILMKGESVANGQVAALGSGCLIQIRGMNFMFEINDTYVGWYLDNIIKKSQGKFNTLEWSFTCG